LITIPNEKLLPVLGRDVSLVNAFKTANDVLLGAVQGIAELITRPGLINVDFADVRTVMSEMGMAMMGTGAAMGENRARQAAEKAIASPLLDDINLQGARGILVNITGGMDFAIGEFDEVGNTIKDLASEDANVVIGTVIDPELHDELRVTVVATGLNNAIKAEEPALKVVNTDINGEPDYGKLDRPTVIRQKPTKKLDFGRRPVPEERDLDLLDIPAFLRRQAD